MFEDMMEGAGELEASIFAHCFDEGAMQRYMPARAPKRARPEQQFRGMGAGNRFAPVNMYGAPPQQQQAQDPLRLMCRVILQQEETIAHLRHEKCFVMFMKHEQEGILKPLMMVAKEWNEKRSQTPEKLTSPLRTLLLQSMLQELLQRVQKEAATEDGRTALQKKGWLTKENHWPYLAWDSKTKQLVLNQARQRVPHTEIVRLLTWMLREMKGDIIQTFKSRPSLHKMNLQIAPTSTFHLEIALRGQTSLEMHEAFMKLTSNAVTQLIGTAIKRDSLPQTALAKQLADLTFRRR